MMFSYFMVFVFYMSSFFMVLLCVLMLNIGISVLFNMELFIFSGFSVSFPVLLDSSGLVFGSLVCFISASVIMYSVSYMEGERFMKRFIWLVVFFVLSMNLLIYVPSVIFLLVGWDGLGVVSFLLVIYYQNSYSLSGGMITALTNRIGDVLLIMSVILSVCSGSWWIYGLKLDWLIMFLFLMCIVIGGMTKSAQMPFCAWLPMAMAAPTPVSALVHSSTLVTAGVYLLIRFSYLLGDFVMLMEILGAISCVTMLMAGMVAMFEMDVKKVVALSTLSQLGFMVFAVSVCVPELAFFHLCVHALFKALIFMAVGIFIHSLGTQDIRLMGGMLMRMPFVSFIMVCASISMCGFPFMSGYFSKDLVIESTMLMTSNGVLYIMVGLGVVLTVCYSVRMCFYVLFGGLHGMLSCCCMDGHVSYVMPMVVLMAGSVCGSAFIQCNIISVMSVYIVSFYVKVFPIMCLGAGMVLGVMKMSKLNNFFMYYMSQMWFLNFLSTQFMIKNFLQLGYSVTLLDQSWSEAMGGRGMWSLYGFLFKKSQVLQQWLVFPLFFIVVCGMVGMCIMYM